MSPLSEALLLLRKQFGLSQEQFGLILGCRGTDVSGIEKGKRYAPRLTSIEPLTDALGLSNTEYEQLAIAASLSPRRILIPPDAPASAFKLVAALLIQWESMSADDFERMYVLVVSPPHSNFNTQ